MITMETELKDCHDCGARPGEPHGENCDTALCSGCGAQLLFHFNECGNEGNTIWTGRWPGEVECEELNLWVKFGPNGWEKCESTDPEAGPDLTTLAIMGAEGKLRWDGQRWQRLEQ